MDVDSTPLSPSGGFQLLYPKHPDQPPTRLEIHRHPAHNLHNIRNGTRVDRETQVVISSKWCTSGENPAIPSMVYRVGMYPGAAEEDDDVDRLQTSVIHSERRIIERETQLGGHRVMNNHRPVSPTANTTTRAKMTDDSSGKLTRVVRHLHRTAQQDTAGSRSAALGSLGPKRAISPTTSYKITSLYPKTNTGTNHTLTASTDYQEFPAANSSRSSGIIRVVSLRFTLRPEKTQESTEAGTASVGKLASPPSTLWRSFQD